MNSSSLLPSPLDDLSLIGDSAYEADVVKKRGRPMKIMSSEAIIPKQAPLTPSTATSLLPEAVKGDPAVERRSQRRKVTVAVPEEVTRTMPSDAAIDALIIYNRRRWPYVQEQTALTNRMLGILRMRCSGDKDAAREALKSATLEDPEIGPMLQAFKIIENHVKLHSKLIEKLVAEMSIAEFAQRVPGLGLLSLGQLIAELSTGAQPILTPPPTDYLRLAESGSSRRVDWRRRQEARAKFRMGVAVVENGRQRKVRGTTPEAKARALTMGFRPHNRALLSVIESNLIRAKNREEAPYYTLYMRKKEQNLAAGKTKLHAHLHAKRYMGVKFLRHFLAAWNRTSD